MYSAGPPKGADLSSPVRSAALEGRLPSKRTQAPLHG